MTWELLRTGQSQQSWNMARATSEGVRTLCLLTHHEDEEPKHERVVRQMFVLKRDANAEEDRKKKRALEIAQSIKRESNTRKKETKVVKAVEFYDLPYITEKDAGKWLLYKFRPEDAEADVRLGRFIKRFNKADDTTQYIVNEYKLEREQFVPDEEWTRVLDRADIMWIGTSLRDLVMTALTQIMVIKHRANDYIARRRDKSLAGWKWTKTNERRIINTAALAKLLD